MRQLHVVAVSEDGRHVVLATGKGASRGDFRVAIDDRLSAAVRGDLARPGEAEPAAVTPKEIQARLRAGETPEQIAVSAGVPVSKVDRYAGPVLSEIERVIAQARAGFVSRSRLGESALPLGEAVDRHLADTTGVRLETVAWSARREETGSWLVELAYVSQARRRTATWRYDVARREVTATDSASAALAHVEPSGRRSRAAGNDAGHADGVPAARAPHPAARSRARRGTPVRPVTPPTRTVSARPTSPAAAAQPARAQAASARPAATAKSEAGQAARAAAAAKAAQVKAAKERAAQEAAAEQARRAEQAEARAAAAAAAREKKAAEAREKKAAEAREKKAAEAREKKAAEATAAASATTGDDAIEQPAPSGPPTLRVVGSDDAPAPKRREPKEPPAAARTAPARAAGQRASVPGWADVLLSTAPVARPGDPEQDAD